jgi:hypothetical protein
MYVPVLLLYIIYELLLAMQLSCQDKCYDPNSDGAYEGIAAVRYFQSGLPLTAASW